MADEEVAVAAEDQTQEGSEEASPSDVRSVEKIGRRQFLVRVGAATATVTVISAGLGAVLATAERRRLEESLELYLKVLAISRELDNKYLIRID